MATKGNKKNTTELEKEREREKEEVRKSLCETEKFCILGYNVCSASLT